MTFVPFNSNTTGVASGEETPYPSKAHEWTPFFVGFVWLNLWFSEVFCRCLSLSFFWSLCCLLFCLFVFLSFGHCVVCYFVCLSFFLFAIVLSISFQFTASDYHLASHCIYNHISIFKCLCYIYFRTENTDDSNEEENLIELTLNGTDDILTGQEISNFISSCQNLNCEKVVDLLNNQLKQPVVFVNIYYFIDFVEMFSVIMTKTLL